MKEKSCLLSLEHFEDFLYGLAALFNSNKNRDLIFLRLLHDGNLGLHVFTLAKMY